MWTTVSKSVDSVEEAVALASELKELLARGGFKFNEVDKQSCGCPGRNTTER